MSFPFKAVLFDWAHTLVDWGVEDDRAAFVHLVEFLHGRGVELPDFETLFAAYQDLFYGLIDESHRTYREACFETVLNYLCFYYGIKLEGRASWKETLVVYYEDIHRTRAVYPDVVHTLESMQEAGVRMGVISNTTNPKFIKDEELQRTRLDRFFEFALYSSDMPYRKPHPSIFRVAVERLELNVRDILFVGDHLKMDIAGAQAVGMPAAWINRDGNTLTAGINPDYQLTSLSDLLQITPLKV